MGVFFSDAQQEALELLERDGKVTEGTHTLRGKAIRVRAATLLSLRKKSTLKLSTDGGLLVGTPIKKRPT